MTKNIHSLLCFYLPLFFAGCDDADIANRKLVESS